MMWVHVRLDLEHEAGHFFLACIDGSRSCLKPLRRWREVCQRVDQIAHPGIAQGAAEKDGRQMALQERFLVEGFEARAGEFDFRAGQREIRLAQEAGNEWCVRSGNGHGRAVAVEPPHEIVPQVERAREGAASPQWPGDRGGIERKRLFDFVEEIERIPRFAVELVDERQDWNIAQAAYLEQFAGARLDAFRGVDHHDRGIDGGQRAIGIFRKVLVARRIEEIKDATAIVEGHDRGDNRDPALAFDPHPVRPGPAPVRLGANLAGKLNRAAEQQELFGESRLARVGVGNNRKGPPPADGIEMVHADASLQEEASMSIAMRAHPACSLLDLHRQPGANDTVGCRPLRIAWFRGRPTHGRSFLPIAAAPAATSGNNA